MPLYTQSKPSVSGGVNQQASVHRLPNQVEEMDNCLPTINEGTRLRNPTAPIPVFDLDGISSEVTFPLKNNTAYVYEYDRGTVSDNRSSELAFIVTAGGVLEIIDLTLKQEFNDLGEEVLAGTIYKEGNGITFANAEAKQYFSLFLGKGTFSMTTVKDTTFVTNKFIQPKMLLSKQDPENPTLDYGNAWCQTDLVGGLEPATMVGSGTTYTWTAPSDTFVGTAIVIGGGGGGSGGNGGDDSDNDDGQSGFGGELAIGLNIGFETTAGTAHPITVGVGGIGTNGTGGDGSAKGGDGTGSTFDAQSSIGGAGGEGTNPSVNGCGGSHSNGKSSVYGSGGAGGACMSGTGGTATGANAGGGGGGGGDGDPFGGGEDGGPAGNGSGGRVEVHWGKITAESTDYKRSGYIWIKSADVVYTGYTHSCVLVITKKDGSKETLSVPSITPTVAGTVAVASALAANISTAIGARGTALADGSLIRVSMLEPDAEGKFEEINTIEAHDTFGDTASFGWGHQVDTLSLLPKSMGIFFPVVRVGNSDSTAYWLHYKEGVWKEHRDPDIYTTIDDFTMPHTISKRVNPDNGRVEWFVEQYDWTNRLVGDDETNKIPSFVTEIGDDSPTFIKDLFFFRNRLGFITERSIVLSETGEYGNFFRTSVAALLDSDRIDAGVESVNAVNLEHSIVLEDSVILFANKVQFRFKGGNILSPSSFSIAQEMAYDVNNSVRPLFMNDRIFFVAHRGSNSAVFEMTISDGSGRSSTAIDITSHVQTYISGKVEKLTGSAVENMLFITSQAKAQLTGNPDAPIQQGRNTVFAYKYYDNGNQRVQSAWFKWTFNGDVVSGFSINKNFYLLIDRVDALYVDDWLLGTGQWRMNEPWRMDGKWVMSPASFESFEQFERLVIRPKSIDGVFLDNYGTKIDGNIDFGEFVYGAGGKADRRGTIQMKTVEVEGANDSDLTIWVEDKNRETRREIGSKHNRNRQSMIYGDSRAVRVGVMNENTNGFRVDMVSYEFRINKRATAR